MAPTQPENTIGGGFITEMQNTLRTEEARQQSAQAATMQDANVRETVGPAQWQALKTSVIDALERINKGFMNTALVYQEDDVYSFAISNQIVGRVIVAKFDPPTCQISYQGAGGSGKFRASVMGNVLVFSWENTEPCKGVSRAVQLTDEISIQQMAEVVIRCVVASTE